MLINGWLTKGFVLQEHIDQFVEFAQLVEAQALASMKEDLAFGDIPDEFKGWLRLHTLAREMFY